MTKVQFKGTTKFQNLCGNLLICLYIICAVAGAIIFPVKEISGDTSFILLEIPICLSVLICTVYLPTWTKRTNLTAEIKSEKIRKVVSLLRNSNLKFAVFAFIGIVLYVLSDIGPLSNIPALRYAVYVTYGVMVIWMSLFISSMLLNEPVTDVVEKGENNVTEL